MPVDRQFQSAKVAVGQGGRLMPDRPVAEVGLANYVTKQNWRREGFGNTAEEVKREGWLYFKPNSGGSADNQKNASLGNTILGLGEARRPNGKTVPVAVDSGGYVKWFDYDTSAWIQIGSGYSTPPTGRRWEIMNVGSYCVFNNGLDLPFTWLVGDAAVTPIYELREAGYASVGTIWESNQVLMCGDVLEILPAWMNSVMTGGSPYGQYTNASRTQRVQFRMIWSNVGNPRDFAATVNGAINSGSTSLTLAWPMASLTAGDEIVILGAGTAGGNLTTTISTIVGTAVVVADAAGTTVTAEAVSKATAISSVVGSYDLDNDGSAILRGAKLQNRIVVYKSTSIFVGYFTGDVDEPFVFEHTYTGKRTPRYRWTLMDVGGRYHIYAGDEHFYTFRLGTQEPQIDEVIGDAEDALFFTLVGEAAQTGGTPGESEVFSADNGCTNELFFCYRYGNLCRIVAYDYTHGCVDYITTTSEFFHSAATIHRPITGSTASERELWFIFGDNLGVITQYGKTNLATATMQRYGVSFASVWQTGLGDFGDPFNEKDVRSWAVLNSVSGSSGTTAFKLYGADRNNQAATLLESKTITSSSTPSLVPLYYRRIYFGERVECSDNSAVRIQGRLWEVGLVKSRSITRIAT